MTQHGGKLDSPPSSWPAAQQNPGFAGDTGEFPALTADDVRGISYVGIRPEDGGHASVAGSMPYQVPPKQPEGPIFAGPYEERLQKVLSRYPDRQAALLPALHLAHELRGTCRPSRWTKWRRGLELPPAYVRGVASFYTMYNLGPVGKYLVQVCTNISCNLCGGDAVLEAFLEHTGTEMGMVSEDGRFTVIEAECLGACGFPTVVQINERFYENIRPEEVPAVLESLK
jgi:NADH:ubiquinone oxidoreductase subunit E